MVAKFGELVNGAEGAGKCKNCIALGTSTKGLFIPANSMLSSASVVGTPPGQSTPGMGNGSDIKI